jgi:hypothetical protein
MNQIKWWSAPISALGGGIAVAATLLHYIQAHGLGVPGGYLPLALGAISVGLLAGVGGYYSASPHRRIISSAVAAAIVVSFATAGLLVVTLVWAFGS